MIQPANELHQMTLVGMLLFFICAEGAYSNGDVSKSTIKNDQDKLERMLSRSSQVIIGHFDLESIENINNLNPDEFVSINFFIEHYVKGIAPSIDSIEIPVPYELFVMRTKNGMDAFKTMILDYRQQFNVKYSAFIDGKLSQSDWLIYEAEWEKKFWSYKLELTLYSAIEKGMDMSFEPDVKYALFLRNYFSSGHIDWKHTITYRTFSLGSGTFADLLLKED